MVKGKKKFAVILLGLMLVILSVTGCAKSAAQEESEARAAISEATLQSASDMLDKNINPLLRGDFGLDAEGFSEYINNGQIFISPAFDQSLLVRWNEFQEKHGRITDAVMNGIEPDGVDYNAHIVLTGEDGEQMRLNLVLDDSCTPVSTTIEPYADDSKDTFKDKMGKAGLRTLTGLLVVFVVLVVLCLIISCFILIGRGGNKKAAPAKTAEPVKEPAKTAEPVELSDNRELVAVISAAIAAYEGTSADGFVVRSIKRSRNNRW